MAGRLISIWVVVIAVIALILLAGWRLVSGAPLPSLRRLPAQLSD
jgi:hypothetical protein